jgi:antitoxin ParD1/3/4
VLRELIRKEQAREVEIEAIRAALIEGEKSGISGRTPEQIFAAANARLKRDGRILRYSIHKSLIKN